MENQFLPKLAMASFATLPQEITRDILIRLPAKDVGQTRCVSQPWQALLSNADFINAHFSHHSHDEEQQLLLLSRSCSLFTLTFTKEPTGYDAVLKKLDLLPGQDNWVNVVGSCHGLALVVDENQGKCLINPLTSELVKLSDTPMALDPASSFCMHGFGYDSINDDYKIVTLSYYDIDTDQEPDCAETFVDVYSVKMDNWRRLDYSPYDHSMVESDSGAFLNGALHWLATRHTDCSSVITAFNLATEEFIELPAPASVDAEKVVFKRLVLLEGCLCMVDDHFRDRLDVWVMKEYGVGDSWINLIINSPEYFDTKPLCSPWDEDRVVVIDGENLRVHNLRERTSMELVVHGNAGAPIGFQDGVVFKASLLSPKFICSWSGV